MRIYYVGGSKGGVGKSLVSFALTDYLTVKKRNPVMLVETDESNPDTAKAYKNSDLVTTSCCDLNVADGWIDLVNMAAHDAFQNHCIVINSAARSAAALASGFAMTLTSSLEEMGRSMTSLWVMNRQQDCIELLEKFLSVVPPQENHHIHVVLNEFFGRSDSFQLYNDSPLRTFIENDNQGMTIHFPVLASRVADELYSNRLSIEEAIQNMTLGNKAELQRWRHLVWRQFDLMESINHE